MKWRIANLAFKAVWIKAHVFFDFLFNTSKDVLKYLVTKFAFDYQVFYKFQVNIKTKYCDNLNLEFIKNVRTFIEGPNIFYDYMIIIKLSYK